MKKKTRRESCLIYEEKTFEEAKINQGEEDRKYPFGEGNMEVTGDLNNIFSGGDGEITL